MTPEKIQELLARKASLNERKLKLDADERFYQKEKERLTKNLNDLGFANLAEAKAALVKMDSEIDANAVELEKLLKQLEDNKPASAVVEAVTQTSILNSQVSTAKVIPAVDIPSLISLDEL